MAEKSEKKIIIQKDGPYLVFGNLPLQKEIAVADKDGEPEKWEKGEKYSCGESYALCRCGGTCKSPFCDGSHTKLKFDGTETAENKKYDEVAEEIIGPNLILKDVQEYCSTGRFCHRKGGTWELARKADLKSKEIAIQQACDCPSGRLVACDKNGKPFEKRVEKSIGLIEDKPAGVSGPVWVQGGIEIESENGTKYEIRNRVALCRCGKSQNKPFCDGNHIDSEFNSEK